jgi:hypothetical protein
VCDELAKADRQKQLNVNQRSGEYCQLRSLIRSPAILMKIAF